VCTIDFSPETPISPSLVGYCTVFRADRRRVYGRPEPGPTKHLTPAPPTPPCPSYCSNPLYHTPKKSKKAPPGGVNWPYHLCLQPHHPLKTAESVVFWYNGV